MKVINYLHVAIKWIVSVAIIPIVAVYKAIRAGIVHIFNEVDRLFNFISKEKFMTLFARVEAIEPAITALQTDVAALKAAPAGTDSTAAIAAIETKVDALAALVGTPSVPTA